MQHAMPSEDEVYPSYGDKRRFWHPNFVRYMYKIVEHPHYAGIPGAKDSQGKIDWIIPSNRKPGSKNWDCNALRKKWWAQTAAQHQIPLTGKWMSRVAKAIHPFKSKPCQTCGRVMSLEYVYPNKATLCQINSAFGGPYGFQADEFKTIFEIVEAFFEESPGTAARRIHHIFSAVPQDAPLHLVKEIIRREYVETESRKLSPGAMANPPDRLDGFHTYNLCCRKKQDTGRFDDNLRTYSDDRRVFEHWCDGDWAAANLLMTLVGSGPCANPNCGHVGKLSADHIGPISLGFKHSPVFQPLCDSCNSAKGNRLSVADVQKLLNLEGEGYEVSSWQAQWLWNTCKNDVRTDVDALLLSKLMRINQHLFVMALVLAHHYRLGDYLLHLLKPELALERISFVGLDPATLAYVGIERKPRGERYGPSKAARMVRIAFEALEAYAQKPKRNIQEVRHPDAVEALNRFEETCRRLSADKSQYREDFYVSLTVEGEPITRIQYLASFFNGTYRPPYSADDFLQPLSELMKTYSLHLAARFKRGEAVNWNDDVFND